MYAVIGSPQDITISGVMQRHVAYVSRRWFESYAAPARYKLGMYVSWQAVPTGQMRAIAFDASDVLWMTVEEATALSEELNAAALSGPINPWTWTVVTGFPF